MIRLLNRNDCLEVMQYLELAPDGGKVCKLFSNNIVILRQMLFEVSLVMIGEFENGEIKRLFVVSTPPAHKQLAVYLLHVSPDNQFIKEALNIIKPLLEERFTKIECLVNSENLRLRLTEAGFQNEVDLDIMRRNSIMSYFI